MANGNSTPPSKLLLFFFPICILLPLILVISVTQAEQRGWLTHGVSLTIVSFVTAIVFLVCFVLLRLYLKRIEKKIQLRENISQLLIENRKDYAVLMLSSEGLMIRWDNGVKRLLGYEASDIIDKPFSMLFTPAEQKKDSATKLLEEAKSEKQVEYEGWLCHKEKGAFWALITTAALFTKNQKLLGFTMIVRNASHLKQRDEKLEQLILRLEESNKELERFAYVASHDLQEPLRMVASFTQLLKKKYHNQLDREANEYIDYAVDGAMRMQQLIVDLLAYSRVSTEAKQFASTDCNKVVEKAIANLRVAIDEAKAEIKMEPLPTIMGDELQLVQLFQNILSNAIKFHKKDTPPIILITAKIINNAWGFFIEDNGIGIDPNYFEQIFLIFQRLHVKENYPGTGVGLAICKKIIDRHGGKLWVESELGRGTIFCFTLPR